MCYWLYNQVVDVFLCIFVNYIFDVGLSIYIVYCFIISDLDWYVWHTHYFPLCLFQFNYKCVSHFLVVCLQFRYLIVLLNTSVLGSKVTPDRVQE